MSQNSKTKYEKEQPIVENSFLSEGIRTQNITIVYKEVWNCNDVSDVSPSSVEKRDG